MDPLGKAEAARDILDDRKAQDVRLIDLRGASAVTDFVLVASGNSAPHLKAMFNALMRRLKDRGEHCYRRAGQPEGGWLVLDYVDVVIHIFSREARVYYAIEDLWPDAPRVDRPAHPHLPADPAS